MGAVEIRDRLKGLMDGWVGLGVRPGLHTYKLQLVPLFREAWEQGFTSDQSSPRLTGDAMGDSFPERWPGWLEEPKNREVFLEATRIWDEWNFIMKHYKHRL